MKRILASSLVLLVLFTLSFAAGCASQPRMQSALDHLTAARNELEQAVAEKGGHRERAIRLVDDAIREVEMGMEVGRYR